MKHLFLFCLIVYVSTFTNIVFAQNGTFGVVSANNSRASALTITVTSPNSCADIGNLKTGTVQVRNFSAATMDNYIASEACFVNTHSSSTTAYKNMWFKVTVPAGSGIFGLYFFSTTTGVTPQPTSSTNLRSGYLNVFTGTTACTPGLVCSNKFDNVITSYKSSAPYIETLGTERVDVTPGNTYFIEVWTTSFSTDPNFNFDIQVVPLGVSPSNENCANAINFSGSTPLGCNLGAKPSCNAYLPSCYFTIENSVFYTFTKPGTGPFSVTINNVNCQGGANDLQTSIFQATTGNCSTNLTSTNLEAQACITGTYTYNLNNADPAGTQYIMWLDGNAGAACNWGIVVLPISLSDFEGFQVDREIEIKWKTHSEDNNDYFEVLKSEDGVNYSSIETIQGAGNSTELINYETFDRNPKEGINYYKLKQVDFDGAYTLSDPISVLFKGNKEVTVYPNPSARSVKISNINKVDALKLYDVFGKEIVDFEVNKYHDYLEIDHLKSGLYLLYVDGQLIEKVRIL